MEGEVLRWVGCSFGILTSTSRAGVQLVVREVVGPNSRTTPMVHGGGTVVVGMMEGALPVWKKAVACVAPVQRLTP